MRYGPEHKSESRNRLLEQVGARAKRDGVGATGLNALMAAAGVTTGAFYSQFKGKAELLQAIIEHEFAKMLLIFESGDAETIRRLVNDYVSEVHVEHPESGCPIPALAAEVGRAGAETRETFERLITRIQLVLAEMTGDAGRAWSVVAQAAGAVLIARAMASAEARAELLRSVRGAIDRLLPS